MGTSPPGIEEANRHDLWWLAHANQTLAREVLTLAESAAPGSDADAWAARALACAQQRRLGGGSMPVLVAGLLAVHSGAPSVIDLRRGAWALASIDTDQPSAAALPLKTDEQARAAFNHPKHWSRTAQGLLVPAAPLQASSTDAWARLTAKFGSALAPRMFDAGVRGGTMAVIKVMDEAGSTKRLGVLDLAELQLVALTDGSPPPLTVYTPVRALSLHDAMHMFGRQGVSEAEEQPGDLFAERTLTSLFGMKRIGNFAVAAVEDGEPVVPLDVNEQLTVQPQALHGVRTLIASKHRDLLVTGVSTAVVRAFSKRNVETERVDLIQDWSGLDPAQCAGQAEKILDAHGLLAHLAPDARERVLATVYGAQTAGSLEQRVALLGPSRRSRQFQQTVVDWVVYGLSRSIAVESTHSLMPFDEFESRAADVIAAGLMLERAAPGALADAPLETPMDVANTWPGIAGLDVRRAYPAIRLEVRSALGLPS
jgi:hypothetical protein